MALAGVVISAFAFRKLRRSGGEDRAEVKALMLFSFGWPLTALFGPEAATLIAFVFAMPFLIHPFVFFMFGRGLGGS